MKKIVTLFSVVLILTTMIINIPKETTTLKIEKKEYLETVSNANITNNQLLNKVKTLQNYAIAYQQETGTSTNTTELCLQYIRKDRYNSTFWQTLLGSIDSKFVTYVTNKNSSLKFTTTDYLIDPNTNKKIDFVHMVATLNTYFTYRNKTPFINTHYAGWAGDLMTLLEEVVNYRKTNSITDNNVLIEYVNSLLGTNKKSTLASEDALADLDALNISKISTLPTDLYETLHNYYVTKSSTYNTSNRFEKAQSIFGTNEAIKSSATQLLGNSIVQALLIDNSSSVTTNDINILSQAFANYVYQHGYIKLNSTQGTATVGTDITVSLTEKHMTNATIESNNKIATAKISNSELIITPINYGTTEIKITSPVNNATTTYKVTVNNIAPSIKENIIFDKTLEIGEKEIISFQAEGTNNKYTWYVSDNKEKTREIIQETTTPTIELEITKELNNKYLICGIKNDGNEEIYTNEILLNVHINEENEENMLDNIEEHNKVITKNPLTSTPTTYLIVIIILIGSLFITTTFISKQLKKQTKNI